MNQEQFIAQHEPQWRQLEAWLDPKLKADEREGLLADSDFPHLYRQICHHLALARSRLYSQPLIERLGRLVLAGHQRLYGRRAGVWTHVIHFAAAGFPSLVRREWRVVALAAALFFGPLVTLIAAIQVNPQLVYTVMDGATVRQMEAMYNPGNAQRLGREREADSDVLMFGFYIRNNTSIGFQTFAGGLLFGLGTLFYLLFNGVYIGAIAGHLTALGYVETFWGFVAGHSAFELTAIALSGAAGLKLGAALLNPGRLSRGQALLQASHIGVRIIYGAATLFFLAAFVEAFWSSLAWVPAGVKYGVGLGLWALLLAYLLLLGRARAA